MLSTVIFHKLNICNYIRKISQLSISFGYFPPFLGWRIDVETGTTRNEIFIVL